MKIKEHLQEMQAIVRTMQDEGHLKKFEIERRVNAADHEITEALTWVIESKDES